MVDIVGRVLAADLIKDLGDISKNLPDAAEDAAEVTAAESAERARTRAISLGSVHGHVAGGIAASRQAVRLDATAQPAIFGAEFGGGARPTTRQFPPHLGREGYMVWPELRDGAVVERYSEVLGDELDLG